MIFLFYHISIKLVSCINMFQQYLLYAEINVKTFTGTKSNIYNYKQIIVAKDGCILIEISLLFIHIYVMGQTMFYLHCIALKKRLFIKLSNVACLTLSTKFKSSSIILNPAYSISVATVKVKVRADF